MKKFLVLIYALLLFSKFVDGVKENSKALLKSVTLADLLTKSSNETPNGNFAAKFEKSPVKNREKLIRPMATNKPMLADLIKDALFQENKGKLLAAADGQKEEHHTLRQLLKMDDDGDGDAMKTDEIVEVLDEMREKELMIAHVFQPQQQNMQPKHFSYLSKKKQAALVKIFQNLNEMKKNDPALTQITEVLLVHIKVVKTGKISQEIKEYFKFTIVILAIRQHISKEDRVKENDGIKITIGTMFRMLNPKKSKFKEEAKLKFWYKAVDHLDVVGKIANGAKRKSRRRRKRVVDIVFIVIALLLFGLLTGALSGLSERASQSGQQQASQPSPPGTLDPMDPNAPPDTLDLDPMDPNVMIVPFEKKIYVKDEHETTDDDQCAVCLSIFLKDEDAVTFHCQQQEEGKVKHTFHTSCIGAWLANQDSCPTCRAKLKDKNKKKDGKTPKLMLWRKTKKAWLTCKCRIKRIRRRDFAILIIFFTMVQHLGC